jgi:hypothetical protein
MSGEFKLNYDVAKMVVLSIMQESAMGNEGETQVEMKNELKLLTQV